MFERKPSLEGIGVFAPPFRPIDCRLRLPESRNCLRRSRASRLLLRTCSSPTRTAKHRRLSHKLTDYIFYFQLDSLLYELWFSQAQPGGMACAVVDVAMP
jgi:hypothetical protein